MQTTGDLKNVSINFDLNNGCQLKCVMCRPNGGPNAKTQEVMKESDFLEKLLPIIRLSGGYQYGCLQEPTLVPYFSSAMRALPEDVIGRINTNGMLLCGDRMDSVCESNLNMLKVSFDGSTAKTFERIRVGASFRVVSNHIRIAAQRMGKHRVALVFTLQRANAHEMSDMADVAGTLGAGGVIVHIHAQDQRWCEMQLPAYEFLVSVGRSSGIMVSSAGWFHQHSFIPMEMSYGPPPQITITHTGRILSKKVSHNILESSTEDSVSAINEAMTP